MIWINFNKLIFPGGGGGGIAIYVPHLISSIVATQQINMLDLPNSICREAENVRKLTERSTTD